MRETAMAPQAVLDRFTAAFGPGIKSARINERGEGAKKNKNYNIWIRLDRGLLKPAIQQLIDLSFPHFSVIAGTDLGAEVELLYIFSVFYGKPHGEYMITFAVSLPKDDLTVPTITDMIPGALFSEREKQEFLGIKVTGIPDGRRLFIPDDFPEGVYPWRKDETGIPESMVKNLWQCGRPTDRPAPPVPEKKEPGEDKAEQELPGGCEI